MTLTLFKTRWQFLLYASTLSRHTISKGSLPGSFPGPECQLPLAGTKLCCSVIGAGELRCKQLAQGEAPVRRWNCQLSFDCEYHHHTVISHHDMKINFIASLAKHKNAHLFLSSKTTLLHLKLKVTGMKLYWFWISTTQWQMPDNTYNKIICIRITSIVFCHISYQNLVRLCL